jgi:3-hydroxybutyryl-CoA dehydratase
MNKTTLTIHEITCGMKEVMITTITEEQVDQFGKLSGDLNPLHMDQNFAKNTPFKRRVVHGMLVASYISQTHTNFTGPGFVYIGQELNFKGPVHIGDTIKITLTVTKKKEEKGILIFDTTVTNQHNKIVLQGASALMELKNLQERRRD